MKTIARISALIILPLYASLAVAENPTKIVIYNAYTQDNTLNPSLVVAQRYTGNCWTRSLANPGRDDAWRCQASNVILDPCFEDGSSLACVVSPWSHKAAILELSQPLYKSPPKKIDTNTAQPWGFELSNGQHCTFLTGASTVVNNLRMNYACDNYHYTVLGDVDRSSPTWKVNLYDTHNKSTSKVTVTTVYF